MKKSDKKIENSLRVSLTQVCEQALEEVVGFEWITHLVNYDNFPQSLKIICVFDTNEHLSAAVANKQDRLLVKLIQNALSQTSIKVKDLPAKISFDSEENCILQNDGKWNLRLH